MFLDFIIAPSPRPSLRLRPPQVFITSWLFAGHLRYRRRAIAAVKHVKTSSRLLPARCTTSRPPRPRPSPDQYVIYSRLL